QIEQIRRADLLATPALLLAVRAGRADALGALLERGDDPNARDKLGESPLYAAVERGDLQSVKLLLARGAKPVADPQQRFMPPLLMAANFDNVEIVSALIASGADLKESDDLGNTALHLAATVGYQQIADILLKAGADPSAPNASGNTPLLRAAGQPAIIDLLLGHGAKTSERAQDGSTALYGAALLGNAQSVAILLDHGAAIDQAGSGDVTPLMAAIAMKRLDVVSLLLSRGANAKARDARGGTAWDYALATETPQMLKLFALYNSTTRPAPATTQPTTTPLHLPTGSVSATIPLTTAGSLLLVRATVNGREGGWFLLDTGCTGIALDKKLAQKLALPSMGEVSVNTNTGETRAAAYEIDRIDIGPVWMGHTVAFAADLSEVNKSSGMELSGVLGSDLLELLPCTLDMRQANLVLHDRAHFVPPKEQAIPLSFAGLGIPAIEAMVEGRYRALLSIDTGANGDVELNATFVRAHEGFLPRRHSIAQKQFTVAGSGYGGSTELNALTIGSHSVRRADALFDQAEAMVNRVTAEAGDLGAPVFADGKLTLDYQNRNLWIDWQEPQTDQQLLEQIERLSKTDLISWTPLLRATIAGRASIVRALLDRGDNPNARGKDGHCALLSAVGWHQEAIVDLLLSRGAKPEADPQQRVMSPLGAAATRGNVHIVRALAAAGANLNDADERGLEPLHAACEADYPEVVQVLLELGADPNATNHLGQTPLMLACASSDPSTAKILLTHRADVNQRDKRGATALHAAVYYGTTEVMRVLLDRGASIDAANSVGATPLMAAAYYGKTDAVALLVSRGANAKAVDAKGRTAWDYAVEGNSLRSLQVLIDSR
ncbi:MAG TPA: ankyrin repeat domain-containing protein, partial [Humisphaera sp.]|nr:ankyrin repeat domain-containing protein [Humisphaera sp.]